MMKPITSKDDLDEALLKERAFVFLWVNWAIQARYSEAEVRRLLGTWEKDYPQCMAPAYRIDVSEQEGAMWDAVAEWLQAREPPRADLMWAGAGALLWLRSGSIVAAVKYAAQIGHDQLVTITRDSFICEP
jgi:hypothetical protein